MDSLTQTRLIKTERLSKIGELPFIDVNYAGGFFSGTGKSLKEIWLHRELLGRLVKREIKARYKDSKLGIVWSLFRPIIQLLIYYFAIGKIMGAGKTVPDYAIFVFVGLTFWMLYSKIVAGGVRSILDNAGLVKKVYLPREIFPLSSIGSALVNFLVQFSVLLIGIALISHYAWSGDLLLVPLAFATILIFGGAIALLVSALNVYLRDIQHFVEIYLLIFFWASPIVYPFTFVHRELGGNWLEQLYLLNPATIAIIGAQKGLWADGSNGAGGVVQYWPPDLDLRLIVVLLISVVILWVSQRVFSRLQGNFAQEL